MPELVKVIIVYHNDSGTQIEINVFMTRDAVTHLLNKDKIYKLSDEYTKVETYIFDTGYKTNRYD